MKLWRSPDGTRGINPLLDHRRGLESCFRVTQPALQLAAIPQPNPALPMPSVRSFNLRRNLLLAAALVLPLSHAVAASSDMIGDIVKAQIIINKALEVKA